LNAACPPALRSQLLHVTTAVLELTTLVAAGDERAAAQLEAMAALLERPGR
jgi:hypothetical protein